MTMVGRHEEGGRNEFLELRKSPSILGGVAGKYWRLLGGEFIYSDRFSLSDPIGMKSPIRKLQKNIEDSPFRIALERAEELRAWYAKSGLSIKNKTGRGYEFESLHETFEVKYTIVAIEHLWCAVHFFLVSFLEGDQARRQGATQYALGNSKQSRDAWDLYQWSIKNLEADCPKRWPKGKPIPERNPPYLSIGYLTRELFLCAVAWNLHHEFSHLRRRHTPTPGGYSIEQEREADRMATSWILDQSPTEQHKTKRALGITAAILTIQMLEAPGPRVGFQTHPRAGERLDAALQYAAGGADTSMYQLAAFVLLLRLGSLGISVDLPDNETFESILSTLQIQFVRHPSNTL
ncbi:MAG: phage exclusion protein Lit family protein [Solimonas sp.]